MESIEELTMENNSLYSFDKQGSTVFVVDDDDVSCQSMAELVAADGWNVETHSSSETFFESERYLHPGCLITDFHMTGINGMGLLRSVRSLNSRMPSIIVSAIANVRRAVEAMSLGAITVLEKPYQEHELRENIQRALTLDVLRRETAEWSRDYLRRLKSLTRGELRVMEHLVRGEPHKAISTELDISPRTVDLRRKSILEKMGCETIVELATAATRFETRGLR